jgi:DNA transformation protein and related proteins
MPVTDSFISFIVEQLEGAGAITTKRMFGGVGIYAGDLFFALLSRDVLYLKVDDSNRPDFEAAGSGPFSPYGPGGETMQYYEVPAEVLEDADELCRWAARAMAVARAKKANSRKLPAKKPAGTRPRTLDPKPRLATRRKSR